MPTRKTTNNKLTNWLLRSLLVVGQRTSSTQAGFVLPTVVMVTLVVTLLTAALVVRSFDRAKNASNTRVNEVVLNAATPALDRAKAKIDALFDDPSLPRSTPADIALYNAVANNLDKYTFGDEKPVKVLYDIDGDNTIKTIKSDPSTVTIDKSESLATAWRFPVDTDNNGKFDSYTLYGIYFRSPNITNGQPSSERNPLEARTKPMDDTAGTGQCAAALGSAASLVGNTGWYKTGSKIKKSFFTYSVTVPINNPPAGDAKYEKYVGNKGFSAIEYQQDRARIPLSNNAVVYEDDLQISPGPAFRLNGRVVTNSNFLVSKVNQPIRLYQVSSKESCYFDEESAKILVGGNVSNGTFTRTTGDEVNVDLFQGLGKDIKADKVNSTNKSTSNDANVIAYNSAAYNERINLLVEAQLAKATTTDPSDVQTKVAAADASVQNEVRRKELEIYFRNRTRRVPFYEVPGTSGTATALGTYTTTNVLQGSGDTLRPPDAWIYPTSPTDGTTSTGYTGLTLVTSQLQALNPDKQKELRKEDYLGDRIKVGNNLPSLWWFTKILNFASDDQPQEMTGVAWTDGSTPRGRYTRVRRLDDLGITDRNGFWEQASTAGFNAADQTSGGLRIITGAGVYERRNSFLPPPTYDDPTTAAIESGAEYIDPKNTAQKYPMVWPDTMPMSPGGANSQVFNNAAVTPGWTQLPSTLPAATGTTIDPNTPQYAKGDLRMRAAAVYHYASDPYTGVGDYQRPIACVSSYYDPTNAATARNPSGLGTGTDVSGEVSGTQPTFSQGARSNNGVVYPVASGQTAADLTGVSRPDTTTNLFSGNENSTTTLGRLYYQANLKFPNGRFVNEPLREALIKKADSKPLTLREQAAIDSTLCSLSILNGATPSNSIIPHGAIKEVAFLDGRQIKAASRDNDATPALETFTNDGRNTTDVNIKDQEGYRLELEQRQPLEIRATALDMDLLRSTTITGGSSQEYLLPNSGIIYASRDDALLDLSDDPARSIDQRKLASPVDFKLDPTRRPNGIVLFNGSKLWRTNTFREAEKGLIFATDLPTYIQGSFNLHTQEEFKNPDLLEDDWGNFYDRKAENINKNFACRKDDPRLPECTVGDEWRPATVLADAVTLLSGNFRFGFRNEGGYDLANNTGNRSSIKDRLKNGFWNNDFAVSGLSSNAPFTVNGTAVTATDASYTGTSANAPKSSYFNNFVTPVQRRADSFPEYVMEVCRKLPVSQCKPSDWVVGFDRNGDGLLDAAEQNIPARQLGQELKTAGLLDGGDNILSNTEVNWTTAFGVGGKSPLDRLGAGTTAKPALVEADRRFARRVAFARDIYNALVFTEISDTAAAKPMGVGCPLDATGNNPINNGCTYPSTTTSTAGVNMGLPANNALWFRTTNSTKGRPFCTALNNPAGCVDNNDKISYAADEPLYYVPPENGGTKLILPDTFCFTGTAIVDCKNTAEAGVLNLNLPRNDGTYKAASDYTICMFSNSGNTGTTNQYESTGDELQNAQQCPGAPNNGTSGAIKTASTTLENMTGNAPSGTLSSTGGTLTATGPVNIYTLSSDFANGAVINLNAGAYPDAVFVIKGNTVQFGANCPTTTAQQGSNCGAGVRMNLNGVGPNNIFWALKGAPQFENVNNTGGGTIISGNFIGSGTGAPSVGTNVQVNGGRFLGFQTAPNVGGNATIRAVTADGQPLLAPVVQLQNTTATPSSTTNDDAKATNWIQKAASTTVNAVFASGDTPARVDPKATKTYPTEDNGGLQNFVRFLETWSGVDSRISGSFIQLKRSNFATAPLVPVSNGFEPTSLFDYATTYKTDNEGGRVPFYTPPTRKWGFDVALLSQLPDLFSQRFTIPPAGAPNEFFREVGRDDEWVRPLLCAAVGEKTASNTYNYSAYAVDTVELPNRTPSAADKSCRPLADYTK